MRKKLIKNVFCTVIALGMLPAFTGCGGKEKTVNSGNGEAPKELSVFCVRCESLTDDMEDYNDVVPFQMMEEATGTHVNWTLPVNSGFQEKFNLMIASGDYTDAIIASWGGTGYNAAEYAKDGIIIPLKDLIDENMPNFKKYCEEHPEYVKEFTSEDGEIYYIPYIRNDKRLNIYAGPLIRMDWLEKLKLSVPTNAEELYNVLKAFKTQDPNGNGKADEIPMSGVGSLGEIGSISNLLWMFDSARGFYLDDGQVKYSVMEPEFEEGLKYIVKLYSEGLIDPDYVLQDRTKLTSKITNNQVGFAYEYQPTKIAAAMEKTNPKFRFEGIPHLKNAAGSEVCYYSTYNESVLKMGIAISTNNPNPAGTLKWLDWVYSEEGRRAMNYGKEGESYTIVDGVEKFTDAVLKPASGTVAEQFGKYSGVYNSYFPAIQEWNSYSQYLSPFGVAAIEIWGANVDASNSLPSVMKFTSEEKEKVNNYKTAMETYADEQIEKIILGRESIDNLPAIREKLKSMKIGEILKIYQTAYDRMTK